MNTNAPFVVEIDLDVPHAVVLMREWSIVARITLSPKHVSLWLSFIACKDHRLVCAQQISSFSCLFSLAQPHFGLLVKMVYLFLNETIPPTARAQINVNMCMKSALNL